MSEVLDPVDADDVALAAFTDGGRWQVHAITRDHLADLETLADALRRFSGGGAALGLVVHDDDCFLIVRVSEGTTRVLISDVSGAEDWELGSSALEFLGLPPAQDYEDDLPVGELDLLDDLGVDAATMAELIDDLELYADEQLSEVAVNLGFGELFDDALGLTSA